MKHRWIYRLAAALLSCVLALGGIPLGAITVSALSGNGLKYEMNEDMGSYTVTGIGAFEGTDLTVPSTYNGLPVTAIGEKAFYGLGSLTRVVLSDGVQSIGNEAFAGCTTLREITIPNSITTLGTSVFSDCTSLVSVALPSGIMTIPYRTFYRCKNLSSVEIPNTVETIINESFGYCVNLEAITIPNSVTDICEDAFSGCEKLIRVENGVHYVDNWVIKIDRGIKTLDLCNDTVGMAHYATPDHLNLDSIVFPYGFRTVGIGNFQYGSGFTEISFPNTLKTIGRESFYKCGDLKTVILPADIESVGLSAFSECSSLSKVSIPSELNNLGAGAFGKNGNLLYNEKDYLYYLGNETNPYLILIGPMVDGLKTVSIDPMCKFVHSNAFYDYDSIERVDFPESIMCIGERAFYDCDALEEIDLKNTISNIGSYAFSMQGSWGDSVDNASRVTFHGSEQEWEALCAVSGTFGLRIEDVTFLPNSSDVLDDNTNDGTVGEIGGDDPQEDVDLQDGLWIFSDVESLSIRQGDDITIGVVIYKDGKPIEDVSGITFVIENSAVLRKIGKTVREDDRLYVSFEGVELGTSIVRFNDSKTGFSASVPITVFQNRYHSYTLSSVPAQRIEKFESNFYNVNGIYVDQYEYSVNDDGSADVRFDVYNTLYTYGAVEVYDAEGNLDDVVVIDKMKSNSTSIKSAVLDNTWCLLRDLATMDYGTYRQESGFSVKTPVNVKIPKGGCIAINMDAATLLLSLINNVDMFMQSLSLLGDVKNYTSTTAKAFMDDFSRELVDSRIYIELLKNEDKILKKIGTNLGKELFASKESLGDFLSSFSKNLKELNLIEVILDSSADVGISAVEGAFTNYLFGFVGVTMNWLFFSGKCANLAIQSVHLARSVNGGSIVIQNQGGGYRAVSQVKVKSEVNFEDDVALSVFTVTPSVEFLEEIKKHYPETYEEIRNAMTYTYDISMVRAGKEYQIQDAVKVYIPIPGNISMATYSKQMKVYRVETDGSLTEMETEIEGGCLVFETDHFSLYMTVCPNEDENIPVCDILDYEYTVSENGTAVIVGYNGIDSIIEIPGMIDGHTVTDIAEGCFASNEVIKSVLLPVSLRCLGDEAFLGCVNLESVSLFNRIKSIGEKAFDDCQALEKICYFGSESEWEHIAIDACNKGLTDAHIEFAEEHIASPDSQPSTEESTSDCGDRNDGTDKGDNLLIWIIALPVALSGWIVALIFWLKLKKKCRIS